MQPKIAYIQASWHADITDHCKKSCVSELDKNNIKIAYEDIYSVPGSLEIPLMCKQCILRDKYDIVLVSGFIVDGGIYRHDFVAQAVIQGIMDVSLETNTPILSSILTPHQFHEHDVHASFFS